MLNPLDVNLPLSGQLLLAGVTTIISTSCTLVTIWYKNKLDKRKSPDLADPDFEDLIQPILDSIQAHTNAYRVNYMEGKNGTNTLSGYHMKTLNCMAESNQDGVSSISEELRDIPVDVFKRIIATIKSSKEGYAITDESRMADSLSKVYAGYNMNKVIAFKVCTSFNKWTGILSIGFEDNTRAITDNEIAWLQLQARRIGIILKK